MDDPKLITQAMAELQKNEAVSRIWWITIATWGGIFGYVMRSLDNHEKPTWSRGLLEAGSSGFVGLLVVYFCSALGLSEHWIGITAGISGWLGASVSINLLQKTVYERLGIRSQRDKDAQDVQQDAQIDKGNS